MPRTFWTDPTVGRDRRWRNRGASGYIASRCLLPREHVETTSQGSVSFDETRPLQGNASRKGWCPHDQLIVCGRGEQREMRAEGRPVGGLVSF